MLFFGKENLPNKRLSYAITVQHKVRSSETVPGEVEADSYCRCLRKTMDIVNDVCIVWSQEMSPIYR